MGVADICKRPKNVTNNNLVEHDFTKAKENSETGNDKAIQISVSQVEKGALDFL